MSIEESGDICIDKGQLSSTRDTTANLPILIIRVRKGQAEDKEEDRQQQKTIYNKINETPTILPLKINEAWIRLKNLLCV